MLVKSRLLAFWLTAILNLLLLSEAWAQWSTTTLSQARTKPASATVGSKIFFAGGWNGSAQSDVVDIYDNSTNNWSTTTLSIPRSEIGAASVGTKAMFAGGVIFNGKSNVVDIYDNSTNNWTTATLSVARYAIVAATVGTKVLFAGGVGTDYSDVVDIYDNSNNSWTTATLSQARIVNGAATVGTKVFFPGGNNGVSNFAVVDVYDNSTNSWTTMSLSAARSIAAVAAVGSKLIVAGGHDGEFTDVVDIYNNSTNTWSTAKISLARPGIACATIGTKVFFGGGNYSGYSNIVDVYDSNTNLWGITTFSSPRTNHAGASVGTKVIFAGGENSSVSNVVDLYDTSCNGPPVGTTPESPVAICPGASISFTAFGSSSYTWTPSSGLSATSGALVTANPSVTTTYGVTGTTNACFRIVPLTITVTSTACPTITSITPPKAAVGTTVNIDGYNLSPNLPQTGLRFNGVQATLTGASINRLTTTVPVGATTGPVSYTLFGFVATSPGNFEVTCAGAPLTVSPDIEFCEGTSTVLTASGASTYTWSPSEGLSATTGSSVTASPTTYTNYTVTGTDINGCSASAVINVMVNPCAPTITSFIPINGLAGTVVTISGMSFGAGLGLNTVKFNGVTAAVTSASVTTITATVPLGAATGPITVEAAMQTATSGINFNVCSPPNVSVSPGVTTCSGMANTLVASGADTYSWSPSTGLSATTGSSVMANPTNSTTYTVTGTSEEGCTNTATVSVVVSGCVAVTSFLPLSGPVGTMVIITGGGFSAVPTSNTVKFNGVTTTVTSSSVSSLTVAVPDGATTGPITVTRGGETGTSATDFNVCIPPNVTVSSGVTICAGASTPLVASGAFTYSWSPSAGLSATTGSSVTASPTNTTTYTVTGADENGCTKAVTVSVVVGTCPVITSFFPIGGPYGTVVTITGSGFSTAPSSNTVRFDGIQAAVTAASATSLTVSVPNFATSGFITVTKGGFTGTSPTPFSICLPPNVTVSPGVTICPGASSTLVASGDFPFAYSWSPSTGLSSTIGDTVTASPTVTTTYSVTGTDDFGCSKTLTVKVTVIPCPVSRLGRFSVDKTSGCVPLTVTIMDTNLVTTGQCTSGNPCLMDFEGKTPPQQQQNQFTFTYNTPGTYTLSVLYQSIGADDITITVNAPPTVTVNSPTICIGQSAALTAAGASSYLWSNNATIGSINVSPTSTTTYSVTGTSSQGCTAVVNSTVTVLNLCPSLSVTIKEPTSVPAGAIGPVVATVAGGVSPVKIILFHRKIRATAFTAEPEVIVTGNEYSTLALPDWLDEIGMEYYFQVRDLANQLEVSLHGFRYWNLVDSPVPGLSSGSTQEDYRIFSVPRQLSDKRVEAVFREVIEVYGGFDEEKWRLVQYRKGENINFDQGLTSIEEGKGYWFLSVDPMSIGVTGTPIAANQGNPFILNLDQGWTQIGNPFDFDVSWSDVLARNGNPVSVGSLYVFDPSINGFRQSDNLKAWGGGFINSTNARTIQIPVNVMQATGGRASSTRGLSDYKLDESSWFVPLTIEQGKASHNMGGIGMSWDACIGKDQYDENSLPRFVSYLELNSYHDDYFQPSFMRDIVPTTDSYNWDLVIESNFKEPSARISWDFAALGINNANLFLFDEGSKVILDMKKSGSYQFELKGKRKLKILYGIDDKHVRPESIGLGVPFPNPFSGSSAIPFIATGNSGPLQLSIYDMMGRRLRDLARGEFEPGVHQVLWDATDENGDRVSNGIYLVRLLDNEVTSKEVRIMVK